MSIDANKAALRRAVNNWSLDTLELHLQFYHPDAKIHYLPPGLPQGREGARLFYQAVFAAFPDARLAIDDLVSEEDKIACRFTIEGTHRGEFMGAPPTGRRLTFSVISIFHFAGGQCVERWAETNLLQQLTSRAQ